MSSSEGPPSLKVEIPPTKAQLFTWVNINININTNIYMGKYNLYQHV